MDARQFVFTSYKKFLNYFIFEDNIDSKKGYIAFFYDQGNMENLHTKAHWSILFLILFSLAVKMEKEEDCRAEDFKNIATPFLPLEKGIFHLA